MSVTVTHAAASKMAGIEHSTINLLKALTVMAFLIMLGGGWFFTAQSNADTERDKKITQNATDIRSAETAQSTERATETIQDEQNQKDIRVLKRGQSWANTALIRIGEKLNVPLPDPPPPE